MISGGVGMSLAIVMRHTRFEDKRVSGKTALILLAERKNCTTLDNCTPASLKALEK